MVPHPFWFLSTWIGGRRARVLRRDGICGAGGAAAARRRRIRLSARGVRTARRVHDRVDVVRRRIRRRHGGERDLSDLRARTGSFRALPIRRRFSSIPLPYVPLTFSRHTLLAIAAIWLFAFVHIRGVGPGRAVMNVLATLKVTALLVFIALGFAVGVGIERQSAAGGGAGRARRNWLLALVPVMFTYSGWNAAAYMAEEIRDPGRNVPRALADGDDRRHHHLRAAQHAVSLCDAGRRARRSEGQRVRPHRRAHARRARRRRSRASSRWSALRRV